MKQNTNPASDGATCCASSDGIKKFSPEWKAKIADGMRRAHAENRAGGFGTENRAWEKVTPAGRRKTVAAAVAKTTGAGGFGKMKGGRQDHQFAATWIIEEPDGEEVEVNNLREWCRANAHRFEPVPGCKMPIWDRAAAGIRNAAPGNKHGRTHWKGWRVIQILHNAAVDTRRAEARIQQGGQSPSYPTTCSASFEL